MDEQLNQSAGTGRNDNNVNLIDQHPSALREVDQPGAREEHLEDRIHEVLEQKLVSLLDEESTNREIRWLRRQVNWSLGILVMLIFALGGTFTWFAYRLQTQEQTVTRPVDSSVITSADLERIEQLEAQIQNQLQGLGERLPENLPDILSKNQDQLQTLSQQLETVETTVNKNQEALTQLETSVNELKQSLFLKDSTSSNAPAVEPESESQ